MLPSKIAPQLTSSLVQEASVSLSVYSLPQDPQAEVCWPDSFPAPVKPVPGTDAPQMGVVRVGEVLILSSAVLSSSRLGEPYPA